MASERSAPRPSFSPPGAVPVPRELMQLPTAAGDGVVRWLLRVGIALGLAFASVFSRVQPMVFGDTTHQPLVHPPAAVPVFVHLGLGLMLGLYIPPYLDGWYRQAAAMLGN